MTTTATVTYDPRHPEHYAKMKPEPIDVIRAWALNFNLGAVVKHVARAGRKGAPLMDLKKASSYLAHEIAAQEAELRQRIEEAGIDGLIPTPAGVKVPMEIKTDASRFTVRPLRKDGETTAQFLERLNPTEVKAELRAMWQWAAAHGIRLTVLDQFHAVEQGMKKARRSRRRKTAARKSR